VDFSVIVTVGPATLNADKLKAIDSFGRCIYRINGAHVDGARAQEMVEVIRAAVPTARIMMDLPGNKIRTSHLTTPFELVDGKTLRIDESQVNYPRFHEHLSEGDVLHANDSLYTLEVVGFEGSTIVALSHSDGVLQSNKGIHVRGIHKDLPFLFPHDVELIDATVESRLDILSLSFVRTAQDIRETKALLAQKAPDGDQPEIFAKIETKAAVKALGYILDEVSTINVDRGDLSADVGLLRVPRMQERIVAGARRANKRVFLATQFLKNMEERPIPLIAELTNLHQTILSGVSGIQLSEETAVGLYAEECVKLVFDVYRESFSGG
jgi:pyruvate kinase